MTSDPDVTAGSAPGTGPPGRVLLEARFDSRSLFTLRSAVAAHATTAGLSRQRSTTSRPSPMSWPPTPSGTAPATGTCA